MNPNGFPVTGTGPDIYFYLYNGNCFTFKYNWIYYNVWILDIYIYIYTVYINNLKEYLKYVYFINQSYDESVPLAWQTFIACIIIIPL